MFIEDYEVRKIRYVYDRIFILGKYLKKFTYSILLGDRLQYSYHLNNLNTQNPKESMGHTKMSHSNPSQLFHISLYPKTAIQTKLVLILLSIQKQT